MNRNHPHPTLLALTFFLAIVACVPPAQTIQPAPTLDQIAIEAAVAGTQQVAAQQTEQAHPVTATVSGMDIPTETEVISSYQTSLAKRADGSIQFRDYRAGVQILFPPNWLPVRVGEPEYYDLWEKMGVQNQWFLEEIGWLQSLDLDVFRVTAYDMHPDHLLYGTLPKINVVFQQDDPRTLKQVEADEKKMIVRSVRSGHRFLSSDFQTTAGGTPVLVFQAQWDAKSYPATYYKGTFFKVPTGLMVIDFYIPSDYEEALRPEHDQIIGSITLFNP